MPEENTRLKLYDASFVQYEDQSMRSFHDGQAGGSHEQLFYIRNKDPAKWYTNIKLTPTITGVYDDAGEFGTTGWGLKLMYGKRRPTEEEWDQLKSGAPIYLPDIGSIEAADTFTNHPVWARVFCPGGEDAQIRENMQIKITYSVKEVDE